MKMPFERTRSVAQTHALLTELARDTEVPERINKTLISFYVTFPLSRIFCRLAVLKSKRKN